MTMPSKMLLVCSALTGCMAFAMQPVEDVFISHKADILAGRVWHIDRYYFGIGTASPLSQAQQSANVVKDHAQLLASANLIQRMMAEHIAWPQSISAEQRNQLISSLVCVLDAKAKVTGLSVVYSSNQAKTWTVVVSVEEAHVSGLQEINFGSARKILLQEKFLLGSSLPVETLIALRKTLSPIPNPVDREVWRDEIGSAVFPLQRLARLPEFAGRYPIGSCAQAKDDDFAAGNLAYANGNLQEAYELFLASVARAYTFEALNMAGNAARRLGRNNEAVCLLLHASYLNPVSPYPLVHLAYVSKNLGRQDLTKRYCTTLQSMPLDTWSQNQLAELWKTVANQSQRDAKSIESREVKAR